MSDAHKLKVLLLGTVGYDAGEGVGEAVAIVVVEVGGWLVQSKHPAAQAERFRQSQSNYKSYSTIKRSNFEYLFRNAHQQGLVAQLSICLAYREECYP